MKALCPCSQFSIFDVITAFMKCRYWLPMMITSDQIVRCFYKTICIQSVVMFAYFTSQIGMESRTMVVFAPERTQIQVSKEYSFRFSMFVVDSCSNSICCDTCILSLPDRRMGLRRYKVFNCSVQVTFKKMLIPGADQPDGEIRMQKGTYERRTKISKHIYFSIVLISMNVSNHQVVLKLIVRERVKGASDKVHLQVSLR